MHEKERKDSREQGEKSERERVKVRDSKALKVRNREEKEIGDGWRLRESRSVSDKGAREGRRVRKNQ